LRRWECQGEIFNDSYFIKPALPVQEAGNLEKAGLNLLFHLNRARGGALREIEGDRTRELDTVNLGEEAVQVGDGVVDDQGGVGDAAGIAGVGGSVIGGHGSAPLDGEIF